MDRSVSDNLRFVMKATGWKGKKIINEGIEKLLVKVDMIDKADSFPHLISGGEQQRVAVARALVNNPELILADEPTGNLDPETSEKIMHLLKSVANEEKTVIMATHDFDIINKYPARVVKFNNQTVFGVSLYELISICIPIYNFNVVDLIITINNQGEKSKKPYEVICIDDGSNKEILKLNEEIKSYKKVKYLILKKNIGRSKIRNLFLNATYQNLLFIDCDCSIQNGNFLEKYFEQVENEVVYGGRRHHDNPPKDKNKKLRWLYGIKKKIKILIIELKIHTIVSIKQFFNKKNNFFTNKVQRRI